MSKLEKIKKVSMCNVRIDTHSKGVVYILKSGNTGDIIALYADGGAEVYESVEAFYEALDSHFDEEDVWVDVDTPWK